MSKPQVRLDDDVAASLARRAELGERSLSAEANMLLRSVLHLRPARTGPAMRAEARAPVGTINGKCTHPVTRRIGEHCAACGAKLR